MYKCTVRTKDADRWVMSRVSSSDVGVRSLIDGTKTWQHAVWPMAFEEEFRRIMKIAVNIGQNFPPHLLTRCA